MLNAEREVVMKAKAKFNLTVCILVLVMAVILLAKITEPRVVGYTYDTGNTVWEMASRCCPDGMDMQEVAREIERVNGIENSVVYDYMQYKVPVYE